MSRRELYTCDFCKREQQGESRMYSIDVLDREVRSVRRTVTFVGSGKKSWSLTGGMLDVCDECVAKMFGAVGVRVERCAPDEAGKS